jgi:tetratricopeptide (TPR) repeat protein
MKRFPRQPHYLEAYARAAERARDFDEAVRRWALVRKKFPGRTAGYVAAVSCLRQSGRLDEATALIRRAQALMPDDMTVILEAGRVVEAHGDWDEAYRYWYRVRTRHPGCFFGAAQALHKLGRTAEAEALLAEARHRYPIESGIAILNARIAGETGNTAEALKRWAFVRERFPLDRAGYQDGVRLLREQREWTEADAVAEQAIHRFPEEDWPLAEYAHLANARQDWSEAAKRWAAMAAAFPGREDAGRRAAEASAKAAAETRRPNSEAPGH